MYFCDTKLLEYNAYIILKSLENNLEQLANSKGCYLERYAYKLHQSSALERLTKKNPLREQ